MDTPANSATGSSDATASAPEPARLTHESSTASTIKPDSNSQPSQTTTQTSTAPSSPLNSREPSPHNRPLARSGSIKSVSAPTSAPRSRKGTSQDKSPTRVSSATAHTASSAGKISASAVPKLGHVSTDVGGRVTGPQKSPIHAEHLKETPRWPVSPRLRSPPPNRPNLPPPRKEQEVPPIHVQRSSPQLPQDSAETSQSDTDGDESHLQPGTKSAARGASGSSSAITLETVEEVSPLASPQREQSMMEKLEDSAASDAGSQIDLLELSAHKAHRPLSLASNNDSGSDSGSVKGDRRSAMTSVPPALTSRQSTASVKNKVKPSEGSVQNMTVETETVASVPQVSLAPAGSKEVSGTLRAKPSSETIRPKKEKKKTRKQHNVGSGTASSKADIFEAKIASAVDEADSSDSEETFVYDSNPPDVADRPRRFHSRTPSATSMVSQVDRNGMRSLSSIMDNAGSTAAKRNMKFVNTFNSSGNESQIPDDEGKGTVRAATGSSRGASRAHHHHFGRWGRNGTNGHMSLFDTEAPFHVSNTSAPRAKFATANSRQSSGPPSPKFINAGRLASSGKRGMHSASYDLDETTTADDERTPLIQGSVRSTRSGRSRRQPVSIRTLESQTYHRNPSMLNRFASCLVLTVMLLLVVSGAIGFMFATSQPLTDVELVSINTVIASETELMFDLAVKAHNPNVVVVVVDQADIEVFAKSPYAGTDSQYHRYGHDRSKDGQNSDGTWGDGEDPVDNKAPNMRLGTIGHLDSPLSFEGSFFNQGVSASTGEVRLRAPGNGTISGSDRWEKIIQQEFDLIIKGVLKYSLPLSQRVRSVTISGRTTVKPNSADNPDLKPNETEPVVFVS
ncbi:Vacuolar inheritance and morphology protein [Gnomoniopsis smithogilvyi]|uniref:Vacuolar inheritance and morphology protein n=1 Tax=Gnomoniopsis smithogilvyi TaxID=1191159 RepID=A0A9W8Z2R9_9PEZI|nr:Vacuolar inheritance and morphology protein [Gnomoniopsis smithogilvyi]